MFWVPDPLWTCVGRCAALHWLQAHSGNTVCRLEMEDGNTSEIIPQMVVEEKTKMRRWRDDVKPMSTVR